MFDFTNANRRWVNKEPDAPAMGNELMLLSSQRGFYGQRNLGILVSISTLLLQFISFVTTLQGATLFLAGTFVLAPLFFAVAVQSIAWFLSGTLRNTITPLRSIALVLALCCSTYYSYVGIYNNVNPPAVYLAADYAEIKTDLEVRQATLINAAFAEGRTALSDTVSDVRTSFTLLTGERERLAACTAELADVNADYASGMRAPSRSAYANYEDYVAAYNAYLAGVTTGSASEEAGSRTEILSRYGFSGEEALAAARAQNSAQLESLESAVAALSPEGEGTLDRLALLENNLLSGIIGAASGEALSTEQRAVWDGLAALTQGGSSSAVANELDSAVTLVSGPLMKSFDELAAGLDGGVTKATAQDMKILMSNEVLNGVLKLNALLDADNQLSPTDEQFAVTDLHLKPLIALANPVTRGMSVFCLSLAALMDGLTLLFSIAYRRPRTLLSAKGPRRVLAQNGTVLAAQICACLPAGQDPLTSLNHFMIQFAANPSTLPTGYSMAAPRHRLGDYERLIALLCQSNLAAIHKEESAEESLDIVLLRTNFLLFVDELTASQMRGELDYDLTMKRRASATI